MIMLAKIKSEVEYLGLKRVVDTDFWNDNKILDNFTPEDKYFMLYLLTNPNVTLLGIYVLNIKKTSFEMGYSKETIENLIDKMENFHKVLVYNKDTQEIAIKNYLKYSITKGGKPIQDCIKKDISNVKDKSLLEYVLDNLKEFEPAKNIEFYNFTKITISNYLKDNGYGYGYGYGYGCIVPRYVDVSSKPTHDEPLKELEIEKEENNFLEKSLKSSKKSLKSSKKIEKSSKSSKKIEKSSKSSKKNYGEYQKVKLTDEQFERLKAEYPNYEDLIKCLDEWCEMKGKSYKNYYLAIKKWVVDAVSENKNKNEIFKKENTYDSILELEKKWGVVNE